VSSKHFMVAVDWYGPYDGIAAAQSSAKEFYGAGLYMAIGRCVGDTAARLQYVGISSNLGSRVSAFHSQLSRVRDCQIWLGEVATALPPGRRVKATPPTLDYAEWLHARFLALPLNDKKTKTVPPIGVTVLNRWYECEEFEKPLARPHPDWPDLIDFPHWQLPARTVWFGGHECVFEAPTYLPRAA
jgi:hypothetical protein